MFARSLLLLIMVPWLRSGYVQESGTIRGPITALHVTGNHLLIGQQATLIEAQATDTGVAVIRMVNLNRHDIRAIAVSQNYTLVLSEDGLTVLDTNLNVLDFVQGGGQQIATSG